MITKPIRCLHCAFETLITTKIDADGFVNAVGWGALREHINQTHPDYARALDQWLYGDAHKLPYEEIEAALEVAEEREISHEH